MKSKEDIEEALDKILDRQYLEIKRFFAEVVEKQVCEHKWVYSDWDVKKQVCEHKWVYSDWINTTGGSLRYKICELCGIEEEERTPWSISVTYGGGYTACDPYEGINRVRKKFGKEPLTTTYMLW